MSTTTLLRGHQHGRREGCGQFTANNADHQHTLETSSQSMMFPDSFDAILNAPHCHLKLHGRFATHANNVLLDTAAAVVQQ